MPSSRSPSEQESREMLPFAWAWSDLQTLIGYGSNTVFKRTNTSTVALGGTKVRQRVDVARQIIAACENVIKTANKPVSSGAFQEWVNQAQVLELNHKSDTATATGS